MFVSVNPATGEAFREFPAMTASALEDALIFSRAAFREWRECSLDERAATLRRVAVLLRERQNEYASIMAQEMGKPQAQGVA